MRCVNIPATTANFGCGFDSIGMAFQMYNKLWFEASDEKLNITVLKQQEQAIPTDETSLIYTTMMDFYKLIGKQMPGVKLVQRDEIPMTRGLGSSAACIIAGLLAANELSGNTMSKEALVQLSCKIEGHPDNVVPALLGGIAVGAGDKDGFKYVRFDAPNDLDFCVMIPSFPLSTEKARGILPKQIPHSDGVYNASRAGLLMASLLTGNYENLHVALDDRFHQPYRKTIIPNMESIFEKSKELGAIGMFLSGAGPTLIAVLSGKKDFDDKMNGYFETIDGGWKAQILKPDNKGACITDETVL